MSPGGQEAGAAADLAAAPAGADRDSAAAALPEERSRYTMGTTARVRIEALRPVAGRRCDQDPGSGLAAGCQGQPPHGGPGGGQRSEALRGESGRASGAGIGKGSDSPEDADGYTLRGKARAGSEAARLAEEALDRIDEVDSAASLYKPESDLCGMNGAARTGGVARVGGVLRDLLVESLRLADLTRGAFDPTIKPLMDQFGFYGEIGAQPDPAGVDAALKRVGWRSVVLAAGSGEVIFRKKGMALDFGGIGKGFALDRAAAWLKRRGTERALIELGRSYYVIGADPAAADRRFRFGVAVPGPDGEEWVEAFVMVPEGSLATSSPRGRTSASGGHRVGHILDPRRGELTTDVLSATVWAPSGAEADALATALVVAGPRAIPRLARRLRFEALLFLKERAATASTGGSARKAGRGPGTERSQGQGSPAGPPRSVFRVVATAGLMWTDLRPQERVSVRVVATGPRTGHDEGARPPR